MLYCRQRYIEIAGKCKRNLLLLFDHFQAVHTVTDDSNLFLPASVRSVALYGTLQPKETSADVFLGANGDGTMVLITNNNINKRSNPHPQTLLMPFHVRT